MDRKSGVEKCRMHFDTVESDEVQINLRIRLDQDTFRGSMPSFFMREIRVVRLRPMRAAAPVGPATRPLLSFKTRMIASRSLDSRVPETGVGLPLPLSSLTGTCSAVP